MSKTENPNMEALSTSVFFVRNSEGLEEAVNNFAWVKNGGRVTNNQMYALTKPFFPSMVHLSFIPSRGSDFKVHVVCEPTGDFVQYRVQELGYMLAKLSQMDEPTAQLINNMDFNKLIKEPK